MVALDLNYLVESEIQYLPGELKHRVGAAYTYGWFILKEELTLILLCFGFGNVWNDVSWLCNHLTKKYILFFTKYFIEKFFNVCS